MAAPEDILCEVCHERGATNHICYAGTGKSSDFCDECLRASAPPEVLESFAAVREAHCQYCGGQPCAGGTDFLALAMGVQQSKYMCMPCTQEYQRYIEQHLPRSDFGLSQQEQLAAIKKQLDAADIHMKRWVSGRE